MNRSKIISISGNKVLHDLNEFDVVFGTKGNGRNEVFLQVLEDHSEQYKRLSKFQKMSLVQQLIRDWRGDFYVLDCKTNELSLVKERKKKKNHGGHPNANQSQEEESSALSGKLYTSVRRMMNYVIAKKQDRHGRGPAPTNQGTGTKKTRAADLPIKRKNQMKKKVIPTSRKSTITKASIRAPKHVAALVTPEPSPRTLPVASSQGGSLMLHSTAFPPAPTSITLPSTVLGSFASTSRMSFSGPSITSCLGHSHLQRSPTDQADKNGVDQLEVSAISALLSFSRSD